MKRALILVLVLSAACARGPTVGARHASPDSAQLMFTLINQTRTQHGLPSLTYSRQEMVYAELQAAAMAARRDTFHSTFPGAENVGSISADLGWERRLHAAFLESPEHLFNLLDRRLHTLGVAVVISDGLAWVAEEFGTGDEQPAPSPSPCTPILRTSCSYRLVP